LRMMVFLISSMLGHMEASSMLVGKDHSIVKYH
jgi:hypothetical protein